MKIEIYLKKDGEEEDEDMEEMKRQPTAFHRKVAQMLAKQQGRKKANEMDLKKAMHLDKEEDS